MSDAVQTPSSEHPKFTPRVFSGIQPSGGLTLGNYLGAIKRFVQMQEEDFETIYCMVDLHAITTKKDPQELRNNTREGVAFFIAAGLDPAKSILFHQSAVPEHAQLAWVFNCVARMGWMKRMTQFKDKAGKNAENASLGLFGGQSGSALRSQAIESYGVNTMLAGWMIENQSYQLEHLARFVSY